MHVTELEFSIKDDASDFGVEVKKHNLLPSSIPKPDSKYSVYQYFAVDFDDLIKSDFSKSKIEFKVKENWIDNKGFNNEHNVRLLKYENGWKELGTVLEFDDSSYVYYTAETNGFSYFAMALAPHDTPPPPPVAPEPTCGNGVINPGETCSNCALDFVCASGQVCQGGICRVIQTSPTPTPTPPTQPVLERPSFFDKIKDYSLYIGIGIAIIIIIIVIMTLVRHNNKKRPSFSRRGNNNK